MSGESTKINFSAIPGLVNTSVLPRPSQESSGGFPSARPDHHNPFITNFLGKRSPIYYTYFTSQRDNIQVLWAHHDFPMAWEDGNPTAIGLYYDPDGVLKRIIIKKGRDIKKNNLSETRERNELMLDINMLKHYISGQDDETKWIANLRTGNNKIKFSATFNDEKTIGSLNQANAHEMMLLKRAGFHPRLFFTAEKIKDQSKWLPLKHAVYGTISELIGVLLLNTDIRIIESALAGAIDKPSPFLIWSLIAAGLLALNNVLVAMTNQLSSVSEEIHVALGSRDLRFILEALSHGVTAAEEDIGVNGRIFFEALWRKRPINKNALEHNPLTPLGFKARVAEVASHIG